MARAANGDVAAESAARIRAGLAERADPSRAAGAQAYLKTDEPFLGVRLPEVRSVVGAELRSSPPVGRDGWEALVRLLFDGAAAREHKYAALAVLRHRAGAPYRDAGCLPLVRHLVVAGAWWDLVDDASHALGDALDAEPDRVARELRSWAVDDDIWVRRASVISQLLRKDRTDLPLLELCLDAQLGRTEFWLRKACGWALRAESSTDPGWVRDYVARHDGELSGLTRREALRLIDREG
jgi:3-methyladenine DNA glycosylase AlkD